MSKFFTKTFIKSRANYGIAKIFLSLKTVKQIGYLYPIKSFPSIKYLSSSPNPSIIKVASSKTEYSIQYLTHTETINSILNETQCLNTYTSKSKTKYANIKSFNIEDDIQHITQRTKRLKHEHMHLKAEYERISVTFDKLEYLYMVTHCTDIDICTKLIDLENDIRKNMCLIEKSRVETDDLMRLLTMCKNLLGY